MTKRITTEPHWEVWVAIPGGILHLASSTEPEVRRRSDGSPAVTADWMPGPNGVPGHIDWEKVTAVTWRRSNQP